MSSIAFPIDMAVIVGLGSGLTFSTQPLLLFFDMIKPKRKEKLQSQ